MPVTVLRPFARDFVQLYSSFQKRSDAAHSFISSLKPFFTLNKITMLNLKAILKRLRCLGHVQKTCQIGPVRPFTE